MNTIKKEHAVFLHAQNFIDLHGIIYGEFIRRNETQIFEDYIDPFADFHDMNFKKALKRNVITSMHYKELSLFIDIKDKWIYMSDEKNYFFYGEHFLPKRYIFPLCDKIIEYFRINGLNSFYELIKKIGLDLYQNYNYNNYDNENLFDYLDRQTIIDHNQFYINNNIITRYDLIKFEKEKLII